jgi:cell division protein FtsA
MAIEARLDEIMNPIFDAIEAYDGNLGKGVILTGGAALLEGVDSYISERTGFKVRFGSYNDWLADKTDEKYIDPIYAQLVGTVLLNHEYRQHHPLEVKDVAKKKKEPKIQSRNIKNKTTELFKEFFGDDNKL